ncbi:hypothetical protein CBL_10504 [Carabus blaptoides fortunei]
MAAVSASSRNPQCNYCKNVIVEGQVNYAGACGFSYHYSCTKIGKSALTVLTKFSKNVKFMCDSCECVLFNNCGVLCLADSAKYAGEAPIFLKLLNKIDELSQTVSTLAEELKNLKNANVLPTASECDVVAALPATPKNSSEQQSNPLEDKIDTSKFTKVTHKRNKNTIIGDSDDNQLLRASPKMAWLYVSKSACRC